MLQGFEEHFGQGIAWLDLTVNREGDDAEFRGGWVLPFLPPLRGFVVVLRPPTACAVGWILSLLRNWGIERFLRRVSAETGRFRFPI
jgi:hypothetical protein